MVENSVSTYPLPTDFDTQFAEFDVARDSALAEELRFCIISLHRGGRIVHCVYVCTVPVPNSRTKNSRKPNTDAKIVFNQRQNQKFQSTEFHRLRVASVENSCIYLA